MITHKNLHTLLYNFFFFFVKKWTSASEKLFEKYDVKKMKSILIKIEYKQS